MCLSLLFHFTLSAAAADDDEDGVDDDDDNRVCEYILQLNIL